MSAGPPPAREDRTAAGLLGVVVAQASFVVAVMYFLGAIHLVSFYGHFRLDAFSLGFGFAEIAMQSLNVVTASVAFVCILVLLAARHLASAFAVEADAGPDDGDPVSTVGPAATGDGSAVTDDGSAVTDDGSAVTGDGRGAVADILETVLRALARAHFVIVLAGLTLLLLWSRLGRLTWTAPLLLAVGILLGQSRWSRPDGGEREPPFRPVTGPWRTWSQAVPVFAAGLLAMWSFSLATGELGEREARQAVDNLVRRPAVVLLSTERLSLAGPGLEVTDLGPESHYRYRYTGLRRLIERNGRYYLLPLGWTHQTGPTYVIKESGDLRVEIHPGTRSG